MRLFLLLLILNFFQGNSYCQPLHQSQLSGYYTFIFEITDKEMRSIIHHGITDVDEHYFHTPVDSFLKDEFDPQQLTPGHYLKAKVTGNKLLLETFTKHHLDLMLVHHHRDLIIEVKDQQGNPVTNAQLKIKRKKIPYDSKTGTYRLPDTRKKGLLSVTHQGQANYYQVGFLPEAPTRLSHFRTSYYKIVYTSPARYVLKPMVFIVSLPLDGIRSIAYGGPIRSIYQLKTLYRSVSCILNHETCEQTQWRFGQRYTGIVVFSQPMYRPGDTVFYKTHLVRSRTGRPIRKPVTVRLSGGNTTKTIDHLESYRPGAYHGFFLMTDSLQFRLDQHISVHFLNQRKQSYLSGSFRYEDYELQGIRLEADFGTKEHYRGSEYGIRCRVFNENNLPVDQGRYEVRLMTHNVMKHFDQEVFVPDTLTMFYIDATPGSSTWIQLPDTLFPEVNLHYKTHIRFLTPDNRIIKTVEDVHYFYLSKTTKTTLHNDSIHFEYEENGIRTVSEGKILVSNNGKDFREVWEGSFPVTLRIDPKISTYHINHQGGKEVIYLSHHPAMVTGEIMEQGDSMIINISNPRKLPIVWFLFDKKEEILRGTGADTFRYATAKKMTSPWITVTYLWAGETQEQMIRQPLKEERLKVTSIQPEKIWPGQTVVITIKVEDEQGKPVRGADVTAYGLTSKYQSAPPMMPFISNMWSGEYLVSRYALHLTEHAYEQQLNYSYWKARAGLDSILLYQLLYPGNQIRVHQYPAKDSITQFSPFVMLEGEEVPAVVIKVDNIPVWFSWSTHQRPYSFRITAGKHRIEIRTTDRVYRIDSLEFRDGHHHLISFNRDTQHSSVKITETKPTLTKQEQRVLYRYIMPFTSTRGENPAYLIHNETITPFTTNEYSKIWHYIDYKGLAGPISPTPADRPYTFVTPNGIRIKYEHTPFFRYEPRDPGVLILERIDAEKEYPKSLSHYQKKHLYDTQNEVLTLPAFKERLEQQRISRYGNLWQKNYFMPCFQRAELVLPQIHEKEDPYKEDPKLILLVNREFKLIASMIGGSQKKIMITPGAYMAILMYPHGHYLIIDSIYVQGYGKTIYPYRLDSLISDDPQGEKMNSILYELAFGDWDSSRQALLQLTDIIRENYFSDSTFVYNPYEEYFTANTKATPRANSLTIIEDDLRVGYLPASYGDLYSITKVSSMESRTVRSVSANVGGTFLMLDGIRRKGSYGNFTGYSNLPPPPEVIKYSGPTTMDTIASNPLDDPWGAPSFYTKTLRSRFADNAFWAPTLQTDREGSVQLTVTFPDDVTSWDTHYLVMGRKKRSGQTSGTIRAYKPAMARLYAPRFLLNGDTSYLIGSLTNHTADTLKTTRTIEISGEKDLSNPINLLHVHTDTLMVVPAGTDTLKVKYQMSMQNGYLDGELRTIAVYPVGGIRKEGNFRMLEDDSTLHLRFISGMGPVRLDIDASIPTMLDKEIEALIQYRYECNEQLASKLIGLLIRSQIHVNTISGIKTHQQIKNTIKKLEENQNSDGFWGWWKGTRTTWWITEHVIYALQKAEAAGFKTKTNPNFLTESLLLAFQQNTSTVEMLNILRCYSILNTGSPLPEVVHSIFSGRNLTVSQKVRWYEVLQRSGTQVPYDSLKPLLQSTLMGLIMAGDTVPSCRVDGNTLQTTAIAMSVMKNTQAPENIIEKMRHYLIYQRSEQKSLNTYDHALWLDAMAGWVHPHSKIKPSVTLIHGDSTRQITQFPYRMSLADTSGITIKKVARMPVFISSLQVSWDPKPAATNAGFSIVTQFDNNSNRLQGGKETTLTAEVTVQAEATYVMIRIPLPAGCSYGTTPQPQLHETYREQFHDHTAIFCEKLPAGTHNFSIKLNPKFIGNYTLNPATVELMYFPAVHGNNEIKKIRIE